MVAAHITWRPLGQLFVERGLITQDELEEALAEQEETRKPLGAILVSRGLVSGPELTSMLVGQLGMELTKEAGFGSGLWDEIRRRNQRNLTAQGSVAGESGSHQVSDEADADDPESQVADSVSVAAGTGATDRIAELEGRVAELEQQATAESERSRAAAAAEQQAVEKATELQSRLAEAEAELDHARGEARTEATQLRACIQAIRAEIDDLDAATAWFEHWSGAAAPAATPTDAPKPW